MEKVLPRRWALRWVRFQKSNRARGRGRLESRESRVIIQWIAEGLLSLVLFAWAYKLARVANSPKWLKTFSPWPTILWAVVVLVGVVSLQRGYQAAQTAEPAKKAAVIAQALSFAMKTTFVGWGILLAFAAFLGILNYKIYKEKSTPTS